MPLEVSHSADGRYIYIRPQEFLEPGQTYKLKVNGKYYTGGYRLGNMTLGGSHAGDFEDEFSFQAEGAPGLPLSLDGEKSSAFEWTRLAAPIPPMLPSLNQIGFDYIDWIVAPVLITPPDEPGPGEVRPVGGRRKACAGWDAGA